MIPRRTVIGLGLSQLVCWGTSYYLIGALGEMMAADLGWSLSAVHGGFSAALVVMGLVSPVVGRAIDRRGGRPVMVAGSVVLALGCATLGLASHAATHYAGWVLLGAAMRMTLYDAAFASLARMGGPCARRAMSHVTLAGGLASTAFWPIGHALAQVLGWRGAALAYAGFALLTIPMHLSIPGGRPPTAHPAAPLPHAAQREVPGARALYALVTTFAAFLNSAMSAHMIGILAGFGIGAPLAVWISSLRGIGQTGARLGEALLGARLAPLTVALIASALLPLSLVAGLWSGASIAAAVVFAFLYGAGAGLQTIVRGTLPLVLFEPTAYGPLVGRLLVPSFFASAAAPILLALVSERFGPAGALYLSTAVALVVLGAALTLRRRFRVTTVPGRRR